MDARNVVNCAVDLEDFSNVFLKSHNPSYNSYRRKTVKMKYSSEGKSNVIYAKEYSTEGNLNVSNATEHSEVKSASGSSNVNSEQSTPEN